MTGGEIGLNKKTTPKGCAFEEPNPPGVDKLKIQLLDDYL